jgi:hypothetical protein
MPYSGLWAWMLPTSGRMPPRMVTTTRQAIARWLGENLQAAKVRGLVRVKVRTLIDAGQARDDCRFENANRHALIPALTGINGGGM